MNQDALLERLWVEVLNTVDGAALSQAPLAQPRDVQHVARMARYEAIFGWCHAFDEEGHTVSWWLGKPEDHPCWLELSAWRPEAAARRGKPRPGTPFADAEEARVRLLDAGVGAEALAELMTAQGRLALAQLRVILASRKWKSGELAGLHEALLSADPSGLEGRPGSWPVYAPSPARPRKGGPRLTVKKAHALAFSPDGGRIVAAKGGNITDLASGRTLARCELLAHTSHITWSPDGRWIAATSTSGDIAVCAADTGARARVLSQKCEGVAAQFTRDGALVSATWAGNVLRWDVEEGRLIAGVGFKDDVMITGLTLTEDGQVVLVVSRRGTQTTECVRFDPGLKECLGVLPLPDGTSDISLGGTGRRALVTGRNSAAWFDLDTGELSEPLDSPEFVLAGSVSRDGKWVVLTTRAGFRIGSAEDLTSGRTRALEYANAASFSADSRLVALATWNVGEIWDVETLLHMTP